MNKTCYNGIITKMLNLSKIVNTISIWISLKHGRRVSQEEEMAGKRNLGDGAGGREMTS